MSPFDLQVGTDYDLIASNIHVMADRDGAQIFEIESDGKWFRVLAHSESDAHEAVDGETDYGSFY